MNVTVNIQRQMRWKNVFELGDVVRKKSGLSEADIESEISAVRNGK